MVMRIRSRKTVFLSLLATLVIGIAADNMPRAFAQSSEVPLPPNLQDTTSRPYSGDPDNPNEPPTPLRPVPNAAVIPGETEPPPGAAETSNEQTLYSSGTLTDKGAVITCLCGRQRVDDLNRQVQTAKRRFDDTKRRVDEIQAALDRARGQMDVNNLDQVNAFRRLSASHEQAQAQLFDQDQPRFSSVVRRYNQAVSTYNDSCAGRGLDPGTVAEAQKDLICRSPELP